MPGRRPSVTSARGLTHPVRTACIVCMAKTRKMCKWSRKDLEKDFDAFRDLVKKPAYACMRCGHVARVKQALCKPEAL
jgi:hypothetical protein